MRLASLIKRIEALEPEPENDCPFCNYTGLDGLSDERLRELIDVLDGICVTVSPELEMLLSEIPEPSPTCPHCNRFTETELDAELARLTEIIKESEEWERRETQP